MIRTIFVAALALFVVGLTLPNTMLRNQVAGNIPLSVNANFDITSITPDSFVERAGLRVGDHIEPQTMSAVGRLCALTWYLLRQGESLRFTVDRAGVAIPIELRQPDGGATNRGLAIVKRTTASIFILVAMFLLLARPSKMTWGFFLYALGSANGGSTIMEFVSPQAVEIANTTLVTVFYYFLGPLGLLLFATNFPVRSTRGWRHLIERLTPALAALLVLPSAAFLLFVLGVPLPSPATDIITNGIEVGVTTIGIATLFSGFFQVDAPQRQRLRWVVAGFVIYYAAASYILVAGFLPNQGWPPSWTNAGWSSDVMNGLVIFIPITVAYAVLKHHVLDLNFVVGRGLVYGILTSIAVATFAIVEWLLGGVLAQSKLATVGEVVAAIAIGFWLNGLHGQVDRFVDAVIFRRRHLAEKRLAEVATGLPHAQTYDTVAAMLVREPVEALGLSSAALYRRVDGIRFRCDLASGAGAPAEITVADGDALAVRLHGARGPVALHQIGRWFENDAPGNELFVIALPVFARHELAAILFCGGHHTGEAIDPDEMRTLESLCVGASAALDHLEAVDLRKQVDELRRTVAAFTAATAT